MKTHCATLLLLGLLCLATADVRLEVAFDISALEETASGYAASSAISSFLDNNNLKWLRYFKVLTAPDDMSGSPAPMRVAHMQFKDLDAWASFEESQMQHTFALYDYFFINSRRTLMEPVESQIRFPHREGTEEAPGGWVWQLKYTVAEGAKEDFARQWSRLAPFFAKEADKNEGFYSREEFTAKSMTKAHQNIVNYEFKDLKSLHALMGGKTYTNIGQSLRELCSQWAVTILSPGDHDGLYFSAAGADRHPDWERLQAEAEAAEE